MRVLVLLIVLSAAPLSVAQQYLHEGYIFDADSIPVSGAKVSAFGFHTYSNNSGYYALNLDKVVASVKIEHVGYQSLVVTSNYDAENYIILKDNKNLDEIAVTSSTNKIPLRERNEFIIDYTFHEKIIISLIKKKSDYLLRRSFGKRKTEIVLDFKPKGFVSDWTEKILIESKDNIHEAHFHHDYIEVKQFCSKPYFDQYLAPIIVGNEDYVIWSNSTETPPCTRLYLKYVDSISTTCLYSSIDEEQSGIIRHGQIAMKSKDAVSIMGDIYPGGGPGHNSDMAFDRLEDSLWIETVLKNAYENPVLKKDDQLLFFDHPHSRIIMFDTVGYVMKQLPIQYNQNENWSGSIIQDKESENIFILMFENGIYSLSSLDITDDKGKRFIAMNDFPFASNIKVNNGFVYFLYKRNKESPIKEMYRLTLLD